MKNLLSLLALNLFLNHLSAVENKTSSSASENDLINSELNLCLENLEKVEKEVMSKKSSEKSEEVISISSKDDKGSSQDDKGHKSEKKIETSEKKESKESEKKSEVITLNDAKSSDK